jgi:predicted nuclease of predicted toxin-antitoxin system
LKFKLDENLPADLAVVLNKEGHDAVNVRQEGLSGEDDSVVLKVATEEGRIVLTFDLDFADIRKYPPGSHSGIAVFRLHDQRWLTLEGPVRASWPKAIWTGCKRAWPLSKSRVFDLNGFREGIEDDQARATGTLLIVLPMSRRGTHSH